MVKQIDSGQKGADVLAIVPFDDEAPVCTQSNVHEIAIEHYGGFKGAKDNLVFFNAPDGTNGGLLFRVYDARTGKKLFEDSAYDAAMWNRKERTATFDRMHLEAAIQTAGSLCVSCAWSQQTVT